MFNKTVSFNEPVSTHSRITWKGVESVGGVIRPRIAASLVNEIVSDPSMSTAFRSVGSKSNVSFNKTKDFKLGRFSANPYLRSGRTLTSSGTCGNLARYKMMYGFLVETYNHEGDLVLRDGSGTLSHDISLPVSSAALNNAIVTSIAKSKSPSVDLGVNAFELASTAKLLMSPIRSLIPLLKSLKRPRTFKRSKKWFPKDPFAFASSKWLEYRYGILPLVMDIEGTRNLIDDGLKSDDRLRSKRSRVVVSSQTSEVRSVTADPFSIMRIWYKDITSVEQFYYNIYYFRVVDSYQYNLTRLGLNGLGILNLAWERIPFSFVIDWSVMIGDWLQYVRPAPEISSIACVSGRAGTSVKKRIVTGIDYFDDPIIEASSVSESTQYTFERFQPSSTFSVLPPQLGAGLIPFVRTMDSASLLWQSLPRFTNFKKR